MMNRIFGREDCDVALLPGRTVRRPIFHFSVFALLGSTMVACIWINTVALSASSVDDSQIVISPVLLKPIEEVSVPSIQEGPIATLFVKEGQVVPPGEVLLSLDDQRALLKQQQAEIEYRIAEKKADSESAVLLATTGLRVAKSSLQRAMDSRKRFPDTPSQAEIDEIELRVAQSQQQFDQATQDRQQLQLAKVLAAKNLELASFELDRHKVRSPIQGTITEVVAKRGAWVRPGEPLVRVLRVDRLRVEGFIKREFVDSDLGRCSVSIVVEGPSQGQSSRDIHPGEIVFVSPEVEPNDGTQRIIAEVDNSKGLLSPGLRATMIISKR